MRQINEQISVSPQITKDDVKAVAQAGFKTIICNRPDGEEAFQPLFSEIEEQARKLGLDTVYQPVISGQMSDEDALDFKENLERVRGPVFAYCRSGTRCAALWALSQAKRMPLDEILSRTASAGYDLSGLAPKLTTMIKGQ